MASRDIGDLKPDLQRRVRRVVDLSKRKGLDLLIYCTYRSLDEQARLFRNGRSIKSIMKKADELASQHQRIDLAKLLMDVGPQPGKKVLTWAGPGQSLHNYRLAFDAVPVRDGKLVWGTDDLEDNRLWQLYGEAGQEVGLKWAGLWPKRKREFPHMQANDADWRELIQR